MHRRLRGGGLVRSVTCFTSTKVQILTLVWQDLTKRIDDCEEAAEKAARRQSSAFTELEDRVRHTLEAVGKVYHSLYLLYWYKRTNTDSRLGRPVGEV